MANKTQIAGYSIRLAQDDDADEIRNIYSQLCPDVSNIDRDFHSILVDQKAMCLILEIAGKPVGMIVAYVRSIFSAGRKMVIDELMIDGNLRGQRLGSRLLGHCIGVSRVQGLDKSMLLYYEAGTPPVL